MEKSILKSIKKVLGLDAEYTAFDPDVLMHTNATFSVLHQLGVGPPGGFFIAGEDSEWGDFLPETDPMLNAVKTYVYLKVRLIFDPPSTSFALSAMEKQVEELGWRLNVHREGAPL